MFATNDIDGKYFPERYLVDAYVKDADFYEYFETKEQMKDFVSSLIGKEDFTDEVGLSPPLSSSLYFPWICARVFPK